MVGVLFCSHKIEYLTVLEGTVCGKRILQKKFSLLQIALFVSNCANVEYLHCQFDKVSKAIILITFLLCIELMIFSYSSSLYNFQKVKQQINNNT